MAKVAIRKCDDWASTSSVLMTITSNNLWSSNFPSRRNQTTDCTSTTTTVTSVSDNSLTERIPISEEFINPPYSEEHFAQSLSSYYQTETPVVLRGAALHFPAIQKWNSGMDYLMDKIGLETEVDVEIGEYNRGEKITIPMEQYVHYLDLWRGKYEQGQEIPTDQLLYLAQNDLPPQLECDIMIPAVCISDCFGFGSGQLYQRNLWLGPAECVTPLHFDPLHNFLMQIVGRKQVHLIDKRVDTTFLYIGDQYMQQYNTSAVNVEAPDYARHPMFRQVPKIWSGELKPGDILYIPQKWWHAVRSLDFSTSVNAWWR